MCTGKSIKFLVYLLLMHLAIAILVVILTLQQEATPQSNETINEIPVPTSENNGQDEQKTTEQANQANAQPESTTTEANANQTQETQNTTQQTNTENNDAFNPITTENISNLANNSVNIENSMKKVSMDLQNEKHSLNADKIEIKPMSSNDTIQESNTTEINATEMGKICSIGCFLLAKEHMSSLNDSNLIVNFTDWDEATKLGYFYKLFVANIEICVDTFQNQSQIPLIQSMSDYNAAKHFFTSKLINKLENNDTKLTKKQNDMCVQLKTLLKSSQYNELIDYIIDEEEDEHPKGSNYPIIITVACIAAVAVALLLKSKKHSKKHHIM